VSSLVLAVVSGIIMVSGDVNGSTAVGHACPISSTTALTNAHVAYSDSKPRTLIYSDGNGVEGILRPVLVDQARDLALLEVVSGSDFQKFFPLAPEAPKRGDRVWLEGYDFTKGGTPRIVETEIVNPSPILFTYKKGGGPGSSGSCVINSLGEVVAINKGALPKDADNMWGRGVLVAGEMWSKIIHKEGGR